MTKLKATISLRGSVPTKRNDGEVVNKHVEDSSTNARNLEVIRLFQKGDFNVTSVTEKISIKNGKYSINFNVDFYSQFKTIEMQDVIERFDDVFEIHSISEVKRK